MCTSVHAERLTSGIKCIYMSVQTAKNGSIGSEEIAHSVYGYMIAVIEFSPHKLMLVILILLSPDLMMI